MGTITSFAANTLRRRAESAADAMRERADEAAEYGRSVANRAGDSAYERFNQLLDDLQGLLGRAQKVSGREYDNVSRQMSKKLRYASDALEAASGDAAVAARRTLKRTNEAIRRNPMETVGLVAVIGIVIGFLIASSRRD